MARLLLCVLALCAGAYAVPLTHEKLDTKTLQARQQQVLHLFTEIHEPTLVSNDVPLDWELEKNVHKFKNETAVHILLKMLKHGWILPKDKPFSLNEPVHVYEVSTIFNVLYSATDYDTLICAVSHLKKHINLELLAYVFQVTIVHWPGMEGVTVPPMYEIFPTYFFDADVIHTAQQISILGKDYIKEFPHTHMWDDNVVITWNHTLWPYNDEYQVLSYYTHDPFLSLSHSNSHLAYPFWLGSDVVPGLNKDRRGELWWAHQKQFLARYYMERLSNGLGEIPEITDVVEEKFVSGLVYPNGAPMPARPEHYCLDKPHLVEEHEKALEYERRIWEAIDKGYVVNDKGEHINILNEHGFEILASIVQSNVESLNSGYYKDFIGIWRSILGNSVQEHLQYHNHYVPLVLPSALENYWTAVRDPAFYMLFKRVHKLFAHWQNRMALRLPEEFVVPGVTVEKVEVDKLVTYFAYSYMNITNSLLNIHEKSGDHHHHHTSVVVAKPTLNHKPFSVKFTIKSDTAKKVIVKLFLAPKYDSKGFEIPLHKNTENFFLFEMFTTELTAGHNTYIRQSTQNEHVIKEYPSSNEIYEKTLKGAWSPEMGQVYTDKFSDNLLLPKGKVGGMPFHLMIYVQELTDCKTPYATGFDPKTSLGIGTGARYITDKPFLFPVDRPLHVWQVEEVPNIHFEEVVIHHKHTPEVYVPHN